MRAAARAATLTLLDGYKTAHTDALKQTHNARPQSIFPPSAFVDSISESDIVTTPAGEQRTPQVAVRIVRGTFDRADVGVETDELIDGFLRYVIDNRHAAGANTLVTLVSAEDDDGWVPEWMPTEHQRQYYTTVVTLGFEGLFGGLV